MGGGDAPLPGAPAGHHSSGQSRPCPGDTAPALSNAQDHVVQAVPGLAWQMDLTPCREVSSSWGCGGTRAASHQPGLRPPASGIQGPTGAAARGPRTGLAKHGHVLTTLWCEEGKEPGGCSCPLALQLPGAGNNPGDSDHDWGRAAPEQLLQPPFPLLLLMFEGFLGG